MTAPAVTYTFTNNTIADGPQVSTNFTDLVNYVANRNDGSATWDRVLVTSSSTVPFIANNSTGTANIANFQDNGVSVFQIVDGGDVYMNATKKLYFDGGGDTYILETAANIMDFGANGTVHFRVNGVTPRVNVFASDFAIPATFKLMVDGGGDTYITESASNQMDFYCGGVLHARINDTGGNFLILGTDLTMPAAKNLYLDGGGNTYLTESSADTMDFTTGGTLAMRLTSAQVLDYRKAVVATGASGAATLGQIGSGGPATNAQNSWMYIKIAGVDSYIPIWR
jgi:hypothetical protein